MQIDTNMYLERYIRIYIPTYVSYKPIMFGYHYHSFHNKLKTNYLNGKVNERVDFLIDTLLRIEIDRF